MEIINQQTFFIKFKFTSARKDRKDLTSSQASRANRNLREFFQKLHKMSLDIGEGDMKCFYLKNYYKLISEIDNHCLDSFPTSQGRKRPKRLQLVNGLMFEMSWFGAITAIDEATQRMVDITENMRKQNNIPEAVVYLGAKAYYYKNIKKPEVK